MQFIVTIKVARSLSHNPRHKVMGSCEPVNKFLARSQATCTDSTGTHHSMLASAHCTSCIRESLDPYVEDRVFTITRIEQVDQILLV